ncbi:MAG: 2-C-methyl-D-erythritol 4-phosphate cytidylyltransferase [Candidatus Omnitrophota bacterium]
MRVTAILLAAGKGERLKSRVSKALVELGGIPIIEHSLRVLCRHPLVKDIIIVVNPSNQKEISSLVEKNGCKKVRLLVLGGVRRQDSVCNALKESGADCGLVLVHDSARPFVRAEDISGVIARAKRFGAAVLGVPVKATVKQVTRDKGQGTRDKIQGTCLVVEKTLNRECLWEVQTPQAFRRDIIVKAYQRFGGIDVTDDAALVERMGKRVVLCAGSYGNIKITTPVDLIIAEAMLNSLKSQKS